MASDWNKLVVTYFMAKHSKWLEIREDDLGLKFNRELPEMVL
jgi:hypothetical protein